MAGGAGDRAYHLSGKPQTLQPAPQTSGYVNVSVTKKDRLQIKLQPVFYIIVRSTDLVRAYDQRARSCLMMKS